MKLKIIKSYLYYLGLIIILTGCQDDEHFFEINIDAPIAAIQKEVDGVEFTFCIVNNKGEAATVFEEGENFSFYFSIKNNRKESLPFYDYSFYNLNDFCEVNSSNKSYGKPFKYKGLTYSDDIKYLHPGEDTYKFLSPWSDDRENWVYFWSEFEGNNQPSLPKGIYYTEFSHAFIFDVTRWEPELITDKIKFRINFEIK